MSSRPTVFYRLLVFLFSEEYAGAALITSFIVCILAMILILCREWAVYSKRAGDQASWKGFWRFHKAYPAERVEKRNARRREREARREARRREKEK